MLRRDGKARRVVAGGENTYIERVRGCTGTLYSIEIEVSVYPVRLRVFASRSLDLGMLSRLSLRNTAAVRLASSMTPIVEPVYGEQLLNSLLLTVVSSPQEARRVGD